MPEQARPAYRTSDDEAFPKIEMETVVTKHRAFPLAFVVYMLLLAAVIPAAMLTWAFAGYTAALWVSQGGTLLILIGTLAYAAIWHSRSRWPNTSAVRRLHNILTFTR